jgi:hypothetical protein
MNKFFVYGLIALLLLTGSSYGKDIQIVTDPGTARMLSQQGYTPLYLRGESGESAVVMISGYQQVDESQLRAEMQSAAPQTKGILQDIWDWFFPPQTPATPETPPANPDTPEVPITPNVGPDTPEVPITPVNNAPDCSICEEALRHATEAYAISPSLENEQAQADAQAALRRCQAGGGDNW